MKKRNALAALILATTFCAAARPASTRAAMNDSPDPATEPAPLSAEDQKLLNIDPKDVKYHKGYPAISPELEAAIKRREDGWNALDDAAWKKAEPIIAAEAKAGRPWIPLAMNPEDLPHNKIPAFPGAEGGGMWTAGGRGGKVFVVTNLNDHGPGSFREACDAGGARMVVFNVAGIIKLDRPIHIRAPYITIEGQSAPGDGVCIANYSTKIDTHDVIIRYMRFRRGTTDVTNRDDSLGGDAPIGNIMVDHCSCSWGLDETISLYRQMYNVNGADKARLKLPLINTTIQWTYITEGLNTYHHAFGGTWGGRNSMFAHNLFADCVGRNCSMGMNYDFNFVDNVIFNWGYRTLDGGDDLSLVNVINNYYKPGPATDAGMLQYRIILPQPARAKGEDRPFGHYYVNGNVVDGNDKVTADNWDGGVQFPKEENGNALEGDPNIAPEKLKMLIAKFKLEKPLPMPMVTVTPAQENYTEVLATGGCTLPTRDPVDVRIANEVKTGIVSYTEGKGIITDISQVGGYPKYEGTPYEDSDHDGIPDDYEKAHGMNPNDAADASKLSGDSGYSNLEMYLNELASKGGKSK